MVFKLLGTGAGIGVPSFFCNCTACIEAKGDPKWRRSRSSALIDTGKELVLIDASPDLRSQLIRERISKIDCIFMTHWHYDHFAGLGELEYYVRLEKKEPIPLFLPLSAEREFRLAFPFLEDVYAVDFWCYGQAHTFSELKITPLPAVHGTQTAGFICEGTKRLAYFPDTARLSSDVAKELRGVDYWIGDATFNGRNWMEHSHMNIEQMIEQGHEIDAVQIIPTHMSMHYDTPITSKKLLAAFKSHKNVTLSYDGMVIEI